jgi:succinate dehydrogenase hydrophobic anchor subunit
VARSPFVLALDVFLLASILIHGLNGLRLTLTGLGIGVRAQRGLFVALMLVAALVLGAATLKIYGS